MHVRTCRCTTPSVCVKCIAKKSLTTHQMSAQPSSRSRDTENGYAVHTCRCTQSLTCVKRLANCYLTTHKISAQSVQPFSRHETLCHLHARTCWCTPPMTYGICIATGRLTTYQVWLLSAEQFLSCGLVTDFDTA